jgi:hypothetical protein
MFQQGQPAAMFYTDDVKADYERDMSAQRNSACCSSSNTTPAGFTSAV